VNWPCDKVMFADCESYEHSKPTIFAISFRVGRSISPVSRGGTVGRSAQDRRQSIWQVNEVKAFASVVENTGNLEQRLFSNFIHDTNC
jgi:hypothetical protein